MLNDERKLVDQGLHEGSTIIFKDLGPQVAYATVFFWEYFGPMVVYPLFYFFRSVIYGQGEFETESIQVLAMIAWYVPVYREGEIERLIELFVIHTDLSARYRLWNSSGGLASYMPCRA